METAPVSQATAQTPPLDLAAVPALLTRLHGTLDYEPLLQDVLRELTTHTGTPRAVILFSDEPARGQEVILRPVAASGYTAASITQIREAIAFSTARTDGQAVIAWAQGKPFEATPEQNLRKLAGPLKLEHWYSEPLFLQERLVGALIVETTGTLGQAGRDWLHAIAGGVAVALRNARQYSQAVSTLNVRMNELAILRRIDLELSEQISPSHVYDMTLDWAMRYTGSQAGTLATYEESDDMLAFVADLGYEAPEDMRQVVRATYDGGIARRVARSSRPEMIPDVSSDPDFAPVSTAIRSHLSVPVIKEDRVIAVITVESRKLNHYTEDHLNFLERLAARAGNAMDNARLFAQTVAEREKLGNIISNIADVVIVLNDDGRLVLMNQSAIPALRLYADGHYEGKPAEELFEDTQLLEVYRRFRQVKETMMQEVLMPNGHTFNAHLSWHKTIGCILVLQDITSLKETDQLKNELIATVSHDLKQPLTVIQGYLELLLMMHPLEGRPLDYIRSAQRSIGNMRGLIDDLLSLAKIESGIQLTMLPLDVHALLERCIGDIRGAAEQKAIHLTLDVAPAGLKVMGDLTALSQIFTNLISNAVKYTPPEGKVTVHAEPRGEAVLITVQDTGLGISPEDQAKIFDRFYRVRRPETENIEGTGLGLAIVKRLIELHRGQIGVESKLGEGSRFIVALPAGRPEDTPVIPGLE